MVRNLKQKGFTLIELVLYISLSAAVLLTTVMFLMSILSARVKNQTIETVNQEGNRATLIITQTVRNATAINSPTSGNISNTLSVNTGVAGKDPTIFTLSNGAITMQEGSNPPVALTSNLVIISNLNFRNFSGSSTPGNVDVSFTTTHIH